MPSTGLVELLSTERLTCMLKEAAEAHAKFEEETGKPDSNWPEWYADHIMQKLRIEKF